jgi:Flp pilus assembly protein TadD
MTRALIIIAVAACSACSQRVVTGRMDLPAPKPAKSAVTVAMERQARGATDAGDGDYQIRVLRQRLAVNPQDLQARMDLADRYRRAGYPDIALEHYRLAAERFPESETAAVALARQLRAADQAREAAQVLDALRTRGAAGASALGWLGIIRDELGDHAAAESHHRAALALKQSDWLHNNLGYNLHLQGRNDEAAAEFRKAIELAPESAIARNNLGLALASEPAQALQTWQKVSGPAAAHNNLAAVHIGSGRYAEARLELERALGYKRDQPEVLANLRLLEQVDGSAAVLPDGRKPRWNWFARMLFGQPFEESRPARPDSKEGVKTAQSGN